MFCSRALQKGPGMLSLPGHSQMSEETEEPSRASGNSKAASQHGEALWKGQPMTSSGTPPLAQAPPQGAAHLGAGGHGDVQVAEDVLRVLVLHRLAQERQGPSWFSAAVPHLHPTTRRELSGGRSTGHGVGREIAASQTF